jgi:predicted aminopeptidase
LLLGGCANLSYYWQSVAGQLDVWGRERPIAQVMADPESPQALKDRLARVLAIRDFASRELALPDNRSYRRYADIGRPFVVWNVFAAREFSIEPVRWCFAFAGCVGYRGYFSREAAERFAAEQAKGGLDVYVGGVPAYSTLGWFSDPVLSTFIHYSEAELARLLIHELAHQAVYAEGDAEFNESFAVVVERAGVRRWLARLGDARRTAEFEDGQRARSAFAQLVERHRKRLDALYRTRLAPEAMRSRKRAILDEMQAEYLDLRKEWGEHAGYDRWLAQKPNNAQLASVAIYTRHVPAFERLLAREGGDLPRFYAAARGLAGLSRQEREERLRALRPEVTGDQ